MTNDVSPGNVQKVMFLRVLDSKKGLQEFALTFTYLKLLKEISNLPAHKSTVGGSL